MQQRLKLFRNLFFFRGKSNFFKISQVAMFKRSQDHQANDGCQHLEPSEGHNEVGGGFDCVEQFFNEEVN